MSRRGFERRFGGSGSDKSLAKGGADLCFRPLSMQKTKKSIAKRFKLTAKGKLLRRTPGFRHLLGAKSTKQKRRGSRDKLVAEGHARPLQRALPFGL
jgi:large subunit ribosomal protein L35